MSKRMSQLATPPATMVTILHHHLEAACRPVLHIRSAILKTSQPRAAKPTAQKSMTDTICFPFGFLQDACALHRSTASNKIIKVKLARQGLLGHGGHFLTGSNARRRNAVTPITVAKQKGGPKPTI
jgi:hypothetical protein